MLGRKSFELVGMSGRKLTPRPFNLDGVRVDEVLEAGLVVGSGGGKSGGKSGGVSFGSRGEAG